MTDAGQAWEEAVILARQVLRAALEGQPIDRDSAGALAERVLVVDGTVGNPARGDNEGEET